MAAYRTFAESRGGGSLARWCLWAALLSAAAASELPRSPERQPATPLAPRARATERPHLRIQAKTPCASPTWRDTPPRAPKAESSPSRAAEPPAEPAASPPICVQRAPETREPRAARGAYVNALIPRAHIPARP